MKTEVKDLSVEESMLILEDYLNSRPINQDCIALAAAVGTVRRLYDALYPRPEVKDKAPLILYFDTPQDRAEFVEIYKQAKPDFKSYKV